MLHLKIFLCSALYFQSISGRGIQYKPWGVPTRPVDTELKPWGIPTKPWAIEHKPWGVPTRPGDIELKPWGIPTRPWNIEQEPSVIPTKPLEIEHMPSGIPTKPWATGGSYQPQRPTVYCNCRCVPRQYYDQNGQFLGNCSGVPNQHWCYSGSGSSCTNLKTSPKYSGRYVSWQPCFSFSSPMSPNSDSYNLQGWIPCYYKK